MKDIACGLLDTGAAFWTALSIPQSIQPQPIQHCKGGLGFCPEKYQPTRGDLQAYLEEMEDLLISTTEHVIQLRGLLALFDTIARVPVTSSVCSILSSCDITLPSGFGNGTDALDTLCQSY